MSRDLSRDIEVIKEWMAKEPYLPKDIDDFMLRKFLHSCYYSLERTKKCIERFCCTRTTLSEIYTHRDPLSSKLETALSITRVATFSAGDDELLIHQLDDPSLEKFMYYDILKAFALQADYWLQYHDLLPEGHVIVLDIKDYTLKIITKVNIMYFRDFLLYLLEGMPVRVKQVHVVNAPSYYEKLYSLVKPVLPAEICNIIKFHSSGEGLHQFIEKQYLPSDYGGDQVSLKEQQLQWIEKLKEERKFFLNDDMWKADIKKKPKSNSTVDNSMSGSFKTLAID